MKATIRVTNSILGWMLVPSARHPEPVCGVGSILSSLYGEDWASMSSSDRAFLKDEPVEKAKAHIKKVCKDLDIRVSFCGNLKCPVIRLWWNPVVAVKPEEVSVDLKWSCWSVAKEYCWDHYAPGVWERMEAAFKGTSGPVLVLTGPRKEIRYGSVLVSKGKAEGYFVDEWDDLHGLADTLGTKVDEAFAETIPFSSHSHEPGMDRDFSCKARKFDKLMERIDSEEVALMGESEAEWQLIKSCFNKPTGN